MVDTTLDTQPLVRLSTDPTAVYEQLKSTHRPITLTIDGEPEFVLQEASEYMRLVDLAANAEAHKGIIQGLSDLAAGRSRPAGEVFDEIRKKHAIPR